MDRNQVSVRSQVCHYSFLLFSRITMRLVAMNFSFLAICLRAMSTRADPTEQATHPYSEDVSLSAQRSRDEKERDENAEQSIIARFG